MSKYALTAKEREWLENRDAIQFSTNWYYCGFHPEALDDDYQDAAEFEAMVAKELAQLQYDVHTCPCDYGISEPHMALFWARIAVEEEMDNADKK